MKKKTVGSQNSPKSAVVHIKNPKADESLKPKQPEPTSQVPSNGSASEKLRGCLTRNKIYFETLAATTLTIMATIVACAQLSVMSQQTKYLEQQTTIEHSQALPHFLVQTVLFWNEDRTIAETEKLMVYNFGNIAYNIRVGSVVFLEASYTFQGETQERRIPISGYFTFTEPTGNPTGLISTSSVATNHSKFFSLYSQIINSTNTKGYMTIGLAKYARITYTDVLDETHTEYYWVESGKLLNDSEGAAVFAEYYKEEPRDISKLTLEDIYNLFK